MICYFGILYKRQVKHIETSSLIHYPRRSTTELLSFALLLRLLSFCVSRTAYACIYFLFQLHNHTHIKLSQLVYLCSLVSIVFCFQVSLLCFPGNVLLLFCCDILYTLIFYKYAHLLVLVLGKEYNFLFPCLYIIY